MQVKVEIKTVLSLIEQKYKQRDKEINEFSEVSIMVDEYINNNEKELLELMKEHYTVTEYFLGIFPRKITKSRTKSYTFTLPDEIIVNISRSYFGNPIMYEFTYKGKREHEFKINQYSKLYHKLKLLDAEFRDDKEVLLTDDEIDLVFGE